MAMICILLKGADDEWNIKQDDYFVEPHFPSRQQVPFFNTVTSKCCILCWFWVYLNITVISSRTLQVFTGLGPDKGSYPECFLSCVCCSQVIEHCCYLRSWNNWMSVFTCFRCMFAYVLFQVLTSVFWVNLIMLCDVSLRGIRRNYCTCQRVSSRGSTVNNRGSLDLIHIDSHGTKYLVRAEKSVCSSMLITKWQSFHRLARGGYLMKETAVS